MAEEKNTKPAPTGDGPTSTSPPRSDAVVPSLVTEDSQEASDYVLKAGATHTTIVNGERRVVTGDGKKTVSLTPNQYASFKDKLQDSDNAEANTQTQDAVTAVTTGLPQKGASSGASAASSGTPVAATAEDAKALEASTDGKAAADKK
jgi:hypothetical protein